MKISVLVILMTFCLSSCGTIKSFDNENNKVQITHRQGTTKCDEISYIYSGVRYDLCLLHSDKKKAPFKFQLDPLWLLSIDVVLSGVADTAVLPYTIYKQAKYGNLKVVK